MKPVEIALEDDAAVAGSTIVFEDGVNAATDRINVPNPRKGQCHSYSS